MDLNGFTEDRDTAAAAEWLSTSLLQPQAWLRRSYQPVDTGPYMTRVPLAVLMEPEDIVPAPVAPLIGIYGAGLVTAGGSVRPLVLVDSRLAPPEPSPLAEQRSVYDAVGELIQDHPPPGTMVVGVTPPVPQFGPADAASCQLLNGTLGALVTDSAGNKGVLTAGHVGYFQGAKVASGGSILGAVTFTEEPAGHSTTQRTTSSALKVGSLSSLTHSV